MPPPSRDAPQASAFRDVALEPHIMREPERQEAFGERALRRHLLAPDAEPALAVEHLAAPKRALGGRGDVGAKAGGRTGRLLAQRGARHRHAEL
jgi:hypothetical protein